MSTREAIERELLTWMSEPEWRADDPRFETLSLDLFAFQYEANAPYGRFCEARGATPGSVTSWRDVPAVPTGAFKELELRCFPSDATRHVFRTSGTSAAAGARRGTLLLDTLALYEASLAPTLAQLLFPDLGRNPRERMTLRVLAPSPDELDDSSLSHMFGCLIDDVGDAHSGFDVTDGELDVDGLIAALARAGDAQKPVALCGTAFGFVHALDACAERGHRFACAPGSRIMETGGFKGRSREISRDTFYSALHETFGIAPTQIVNQYGMTELGSQFYDSVLVDDVGRRRKLGPPWARVRLVDPETGRDVEGDAPGLVVIHDLANTGSVAAIQTADLGRWIDAETDDGRFGRGFEVLGREPGAEARGCSIAADLMLDAAPSEAPRLG